MEQKEQKVRVVNIKTGIESFKMPHIANNEKLLKSYGFIRQDFKKEEPKKVIVPTVIDNPIDSSNPLEWEEGGEFVGDVLNKPIDLTLLESESLRLKYSEVFGKKAGNKSDATILKELQDKLTIQN
jgi:hypothetical protein